MTNIIELTSVTKDFGKGRGIFDVSISIKPGMVYGYLGTNGSGKTTTIRNLMGFLKPQQGTVQIKGKDAWKDRTELKYDIGYVAGQFEFPRLRTGTQFLRYYAKYLGITDFTYMERLIELFKLDTSVNLKRMSKGMKQKTALVAAFMGDQEILILDEPTRGIDVGAKYEIYKLIHELADEGKAIILVSSELPELLGMADRIYTIFEGKITGEIPTKEANQEMLMQKMTITA